MFGQVQDFRAWKAWSPWEQLDPNTAQTFSGSVTGVGSTYFWRGNKQIEEGEMTIAEGRAGEHLGIDITLLLLFQAKNRVTFDFFKSSAITTVTWRMSRLSPSSSSRWARWDCS